MWGETEALVWSGTVQREINVVWGETEALVWSGTEIGRASCRERV